MDIVSLVLYETVQGIVFSVVRPAMAAVDVPLNLFWSSRNGSSNSQSFNGRRRSLSVSTGLSNSIPAATSTTTTTTTTTRRPKLSRLSEFRRSYSLRKRELLNPEIYREAKVLEHKSFLESIHMDIWSNFKPE